MTAVMILGIYSDYRLSNQASQLAGDLLFPLLGPIWKHPKRITVVVPDPPNVRSGDLSWMRIS
jgi:hypothetical protein